MAEAEAGGKKKKKKKKGEAAVDDEATPAGTIGAASTNATPAAVDMSDKAAANMAA